MSESGKSHWPQADRLGGLRRFAVAITVLNILGHTWFGFEQTWAHPLVGLATAYSCELLLELIDASSGRRSPRFAGGVRQFVDFLLPAHITGLAVAMLLYTNDRLWPVAFGTAVAMGSKWLFRAPVDGHSRHFFNPSNFGITVTLLCFSWVGIAPPYQFTENLIGIGDWVLPALIVTSGSFLNTKFTRRLPLIVSWLGAFAAQAFIRSWVQETPLTSALLPMTGVAFILYTFYMLTDPATTPNSTRGQVLYGVSVAVVYGLLLTMHIVFTLFFALTIVCALRGVGLYVTSLLAEKSREGIITPTRPAAGGVKA